MRDAVPQTAEYSARAAISHEMIVVAEKLNGVKDAGIRAKYPTIFDDLHILTGQRNILAHNYGHALREVKWEKVWSMIENEYPKLEAGIEDAIKDLETV